MGEKQGRWTNVMESQQHLPHQCGRGEEDTQKESPPTPGLGPLSGCVHSSPNSAENENCGTSWSPPPRTKGGWCVLVTANFWQITGLGSRTACKVLSCSKLKAIYSKGNKGHICWGDGETGSLLQAHKDCAGILDAPATGLALSSAQFLFFWIGLQKDAQKALWEPGTVCMGSLKNYKVLYYSHGWVHVMRESWAGGHCNWFFSAWEGGCWNRFWRRGNAPLALNSNVAGFTHNTPAAQGKKGASGCRWA